MMARIVAVLTIFCFLQTAPGATRKRKVTAQASSSKKAPPKVQTGRKAAEASKRKAKKPPKRGAGPAAVLVPPGPERRRRMALYDGYYARFGGARLEVDTLLHAVGKLLRGEEPAPPPESGELQEEESMLARAESMAGAVTAMQEESK